jgi:hypothetical protein
MFKYMLAGFMVLSLLGCTQETQNKLGRAIQNWTGVDGVLEVYAGNKLVKRFLKIDKLTTAVSTNGNTPRPYRFGYGILDENLNMVADKREKKVYFEFSDYSTSYIFYTYPN